MAEKKLTVALTGSTGFVGRHVLPHLLQAGHQVRALVRDPSKLPAGANVTAVTGDLFDDAALRKLVEGADAVIHLVGIIMEKPSQGQTFDRIHRQGTQNLLAAASKSRVRRWVQMSALGTREHGVSQYHRTKWQGEQAVRQSKFEWTIIRPSLIHGPDGEFMQMVKGFWTQPVPPFVPYFGAGALGTGGAGRLQPVWVEDVARCFVSALSKPESVGETYPLGGPDVYTWPGLYDTIRKHLPGARNKPIVAVPAWLAKIMSNMPGVPFNVDQVIMSQEDSVCDTGKVRAELGVEPAPFESTFASYAGQV